VFRRRRREDADQATSSADAAPDGEDWADDEETGDQAGAPASGLSGGPWDADDAFPERDRADFGSLLVPITPMQQIELATDGQRVIWVSVKSGQSELRVHAFAAPRSSGLWEEVRPEIAAELAAIEQRAAEGEIVRRGRAQPAAAGDDVVHDPAASRGLQGGGHPGGLHGMQVPGVSAESARKIFEFFHTQAG